MPKLLTNLKIHEVSSVNRGAGEGVKVVLMKADGTPPASPLWMTQVDKIFEAAVTAGIDVSKLNVAKSALASALKGASNNMTAVDEQQAAVEKSLSQCVDHLVGLMPKEKVDGFLAACAAIPTVKGDTMSPEDKARFDALEKSNKDLLGTVSKLTLDAAVAKLAPIHADYFLKADMTDAEKSAFATGDDAAREAQMAKKPISKAAPIDVSSSPVVKTLQAEVGTLTTKLAGFENKEKIEAFKKKAVELGLPESHGEVMMKAFAGDADAIKKHEEMVRGIITQLNTGALFKEFGGPGNERPGNAYAEIRQLAAELQKTAEGKGLSIHQAVSKIMHDPAHADLVARNKTEEMQKRAGRAA